MGSVERFRSFFAAVNGGSSPYPWQEGLVERIAATGRWPGSISAPTGAGKSSVVDVHAFLVAERERTRSSDGGMQARPPRRLVLVAPRRVLVEDQYEWALELARILASPEGFDPIVAEVAGSLQGLRSSRGDETASPLGVARLRGGVALDNSWRLDPTLCQVICATPQMWGSRLLMRGYRASRSSRNLEAGLLGHDVVAVVDESHLHRRLVETAGRIAADGAPGGLQLVSMSATQQEAEDGLSITAADLDHPELRRRVLAHKPVEVVPVDDWAKEADGAIAAQAAELAHRRGSTVGVFVNTVRSALQVARELGRSGQVALVCGRMRPADLDRLREEHPGLLASEGSADVDFLVSTQSLEVGADLDLAAMVSAIAPAPALAQRLGRLNRTGRHRDAAFSVVAPGELDRAAPEEYAKSFAPYEAAEVIDGMRWLLELGGEASPQRVGEVALPVTERTPLPELSGIDLETLALTSRVNAADPDVSLYIEEPADRRETLVGVAARDHLPMPPEAGEPAGADPVQAQVLEAAPPRQHEVTTVPAGGELARILERAPGSWLLRYTEGELAAEPLPDGYRAADGDVMVVPAGSLIVSQGVIDPVHTPGERGIGIDDVRDRAPEGQLPDEIVRLELTRELAELVEADPLLARRASRDELARLPELAETTAPMQLRRRLDETEADWLDEASGDGGYLVVRSTKADGTLPVTTVSPEERPVTVESHRAAVAQRAIEVVERLDGLLAEGEATSLEAAALEHDEGKRHPRFQRRMGAGPEDAALAKPAPSHRPDRGDGWRHEQLSAAYAWQRSGDPLATVAVAAHHGHGRALFGRDAPEVLAGWEDCEPGVREAVEELFGELGAYELERDQLQRRIGVYRLAHFEALLRCADVQVSREGG